MTPEQEQNHREILDLYRRNARLRDAFEERKTND